MKKKFMLIMALIMTLVMSTTTFAEGFTIRPVLPSNKAEETDEWKQESGKWKYVSPDGTYIYNSWRWIDGNGDGKYEFYCFDANGYLYTDTTTPDGLTVDANGAWIQNNIVQQQDANSQMLTTYTPNNNEIANAVARAKAAGAGSSQNKYKAGADYYYSNSAGQGTIKRLTMDCNSMLIAPDAASAYSPHAEKGADNSIILNPDPSGGNLQPNWIYNPSGYVSTAPSLIAMHKNMYPYDTNFVDGAFATNVDIKDGVDTSGSWVYTGDKTAVVALDDLGHTGTLTGWMYRFADGTYAANGFVPIYRETDPFEGHIMGSLYYFNENGLMIKNDITINEYGQLYHPESDSKNLFTNMWRWSVY